MRPLSYEIVIKQIGNPSVPIRFVHAQCSNCDRIEEFVQKSHHNPNHISNHFKQLGWEFDKYRKNKIRCPSCQRLKAENKTEEYLPELSTFGQRFRYLREQARLKLDDIATEAQFDRRMLGWLESGEEHPFRIDQGSISRLIAVLVQHGVPVDRGWLLDLPQQGRTLATNLHNAMTKLNYIESALADKARVPLSQLKLMLSGTIPTHYKLPDVAKVLSTTAEALMGLPSKDQKIEKPEVEMVVLSPELRASRLREARMAKDLSRRALAELVVQHKQFLSTFSTIEWMIKKIEGGDKGPKKVGPRADTLVGFLADYLDVPREWLLGRVDDPVSRPLEAQIGIPENEIVGIIERVTRAENDLKGLNQLIEEAIAPLRQIAEDARTSLDEVKDRLGQLNLPKRIMVMLPGSTPALGDDPLPLTAMVKTLEEEDKPKPKPKPMPPSARPRPLPNGNGHAQEPRTYSPSKYHGFTIDRSSDSKQNMMAQAIFKQVATKDFNVRTLEKEIGTVIDTVVPSTTKNRDTYVRALIQREVDAKNGLLEKTGRGSWRLREDASI